MTLLPALYGTINLLMQGNNSTMCSSECSRDGGRGCQVIPVGITDDNCVSAEIMTGETKVIDGEASIAMDDVTKVTSDSMVKANMVVRNAMQVIAEESKTSVELLEHNSLSLNLANLLEDYPLCHLLEDEQALLDDFDSLDTADKVR